jgi:head-tail adaptor
LSSRVLGLDAGVVGGRLRFFHGEAQLPTEAELLERVNALRVGVEERADAEQARADAEQARADAAIAVLQRGILALLRVRGLPVSPEQRASVVATTEPEVLQRWLECAETAGSAAEALATD